VTLEEPPERADADPHAAASEFRLQLGQGDVPPGGDAVQDERGLGFNPARAAIATLLLRHNAAGPLQLRTPADDAGDPDLEPPRRRTAGQAFNRNRLAGAMAQIHRDGTHFCRPPAPADSLNQVWLRVGKQEDSIRSGDALELKAVFNTLIKKDIQNESAEVGFN
jgi:hypothetical protein